MYGQAMSKDHVWQNSFGIIIYASRYGGCGAQVYKPVKSATRMDKYVLRSQIDIIHTEDSKMHLQLLPSSSDKLCNKDKVFNYDNLYWVEQSQGPLLVHVDGDECLKILIERYTEDRFIPRIKHKSFILSMN